MTSSKIRVVIDNQSVMVDTMEQAHRLANEKGLDLVQVAENVYKVMDYTKHMYNQQKQAKKQQQSRQETKEAQFNLGIADHDLQRKIKDICKWLNQGAQVRVLVKLRGREQSRPEIGHAMMQRIIDGVTEYGVTLVKPTVKMPEGGRDITTVLKASK